MYVNITSVLFKVVLLFFIRFERLWEDEVDRKGKEAASLGWVALRFVRTRLIVALLALVISTIAAFVTSVSFPPERRCFHYPYFSWKLDF